MTFANPVALALLVAIPVAWWLHRTRRSARTVRVASLLAFQGAAATTPSATPRRATDWRLVLVLTAMTLLTVAAAGPMFGGMRPAAFFVVIDDSASMSAKRETRPHSDVLREAQPDVELEEHRLSESAAPRRIAQDGLPASLAPFIERARSDGFGGVVLVTDRVNGQGRDVAVVGPTTAATSNLAVTGAALDGDAALVTVRNHGPTEERVVLRRGTEHFDQVSFSGNVLPPSTAEWTDSVELAVPAGGVATGRLPAPARDQLAVVYAIWTEEDAAGDDLRADDRIEVSRRGGARVVRVSSAAPRSLRTALSAAGSSLVDRGPTEVSVAYGADPWSSTSGAVLAVAPTSSTEIEGIRAARAANPIVRGDAVIGREEFADVLPAPGTTLVAETRLVGGTPIWSDAEGVLAASNGRAVVIAVDPDDPRGDWHRDPSFPVLIASALERLAGGPDRLEVLHAVPASESDVVHDPPRTSSPDELRAVMRPAGPVPDAVRPARWLALAAAALLVTALFLRGR